MVLSHIYFDYILVCCSNPCLAGDMSLACDDIEVCNEKEEEAGHGLDDVAEEESEGDVAQQDAASAQS